LPGIDGIEVCRKVRSNKSYSKIKIILQSAKTMQKDILKGFEAGANAYISKPYDHITLIESVKSLEKCSSLPT